MFLRIWSVFSQFLCSLIHELVSAILFEGSAFADVIRFSNLTFQN